MPERELEVFRCHCPKAPILAWIKQDGQGRPFVHIKIYKQSKIFGEIVFRFGEMQVRCRECGRWHKVRIVKEKASIEEEVDRSNLP